jgi:hypothetical protein
MGHDVIISYATIDKPTADAVCAKLEERGIRCWIAPRDILAGMNEAEVHISAIDSAKLMVLIFSSNANASKHVMRETERAVHDGIPILPFRIEDVEPNPSLQYYISGQHWLDALTPPLEQHILKLAETVSVLLNKSISPPTQSIQPETAASLPAPVSKRVTRLPSQRVLLIGAIIIIAAAVSVGYYTTTTHSPVGSTSTAETSTAENALYKITAKYDGLYPEGGEFGPNPGNKTVLIYVTLTNKADSGGTTIITRDDFTLLDSLKQQQQSDFLTSTFSEGIMNVGEVTTGDVAFQMNATANPVQLQFNVTGGGGSLNLPITP